MKPSMERALLGAEQTLPDPTEIAEGALRKSSDTRRRIMDAAVHCLADYGYAGTNAVTVAEVAGMTRSAMLYHFRTRMALIEAAVHYVMRERIAKFEAIARGLDRKAGWIAQAIDIAWSHNQSEDYLAYCELANAARTDPDLAAVFAPAMRAYDQARRRSAQELFSPEEQAADGFHLRRDVVRFLLDGMAGHAWFVDESAERTAAMLTFLKTLSSTGEGRALLRTAAAAARKPSRRKPKG